MHFHHDVVLAFILFTASSAGTVVSSKPSRCAKVLNFKFHDIINDVDSQDCANLCPKAPEQVTLPTSCKNDKSKLTFTHNEIMEDGFSSCVCNATLAVYGLKVVSEKNHCHYAKLGYTLSQKIGEGYTLVQDEATLKMYSAEYEQTKAC